MCCLSDEFISSTHCINHMNALADQTWTILGEEFEFDELKDIANHGADTGVHGFTYSSDLHDMYEEYTDVIDDHINELGYTMSEVFEERGFDLAV
jgi:hypothetical protein